jgi:autotransporter-associated beta strand protein
MRPLPLRPFTLPSFKPLVCVLSASIAALLQPQASAQTQAWDPDPISNGAQGGSGDWDGGNFWFQPIGFTNIAWVSGADAYFTLSANMFPQIPATVEADGIVVDDISVSAGTVNKTPHFFIAGPNGGVLTLGGGEGEHFVRGDSPLFILLPIAGTGGMTVDGLSVTLSASNVYSGDTKVTSGTLTVAGGSAIPDSSTVVVTKNLVNSILSISQSETIGALSGTAGSVIISNGQTLTVGANNTTTTYGGFIDGPSGHFVKIGDGGLTLTANYTFNSLTLNGSGALTITGMNTSAVTNVQNGTLVTANAASRFGVTTVAAGAVLQLDQSLSVPALNGAGEVKLGTNVLTKTGNDSANFSGTLSGQGAVNVAGGVLNLSGTSTFIGGLTIAGGVVSVADFGSAGAPGPLGAGVVTIGSGSTGGTLRFTGTGAVTSNRPLGWRG